jgi:hypothetical protein
MKSIKFLVVTILIFFLISCEKDDVRDELPGIPTSISGNVKDYHRNLNVNNFEIKLIKFWSCPNGGIGPKYCTKEITTTYSDVNGNYQLNFDYNLRSDETYRIAFNEIETNNYFYEFVSSSGQFYRDYYTSSLIKGQNNILNLNAWLPIKIKFNLTVLNNHTPPLVTGIKYNNNYDFGTEFTYTNLNSFEIKTRPNSAININFWYIKNYNTSSPIFHFAPTIPYQTNENQLTELNYQIDCNMSCFTTLLIQVDLNLIQS